MLRQTKHLDSRQNSQMLLVGTQHTPESLTGVPGAPQWRLRRRQAPTPTWLQCHHRCNRLRRLWDFLICR